MKNIKFLLLLLFVGSLTSCSITEKMIVNENGNGKFAYEIDGSKMMSMMGSAFKAEAKKDKKGKKDLKKSKDIDSTFTFRELFAAKKDSIAKLPAEQQEKIRRMENFSIHMVMNEEKGIMNYTLFTDFNSVADLQNMMSPLESMKTLSPSGAQGLGKASDGIQDNGAAKFFYDGKKFSKSLSKSEKMKETAAAAELDEEAKALSDSMKESMDLIYGQSEFKVVYQFPKAVKKVSVANALYSDDRKTITIVYPLKEYMENPEKLNFEVEFE